MKFLFLALNWVFGSIFLVTGLLTLIVYPLSGLLLILASLLLLPSSRSRVHSITKKEITTKVRSTLVLVLLIGFSISLNIYLQEKAIVDAAKIESETKDKAIAKTKAKLKEAERHQELEKQKQENIAYFSKNKQRIISDGKAALAAKDYYLAMDHTEKYLILRDEEVEEIYLSAETELQKIRVMEQTNYLLTQLKKIPTSKYKNNKELYEKLVMLHPGNQKYKNKVAFYSEKIIKAEQALVASKAREKKIMSQFSQWDGSHHNLELFIKKLMDDPSSYEHDKTTFGDRGDYILVKTIYRGKNGYGAIVRNSITATVSLDGKILQILSQN